MRLEGALSLPIQFVGIRDFGDTAHRQLRGQVERFTRRLVGQFVEGELGNWIVEKAT